MNPNYLDFEQSIADLEAKIDALRSAGNERDLNLGEEINRLRAKSRKLTESIFTNLTPWQISQLARHPLRPTRSTPSRGWSPISKSCMAIGRSPTIRRLCRASRGSTVGRWW